MLISASARRSWSACKTPALAFPAFARPEDRARALLARCQGLGARADRAARTGGDERQPGGAELRGAVMSAPWVDVRPLICRAERAKVGALPGLPRPRISSEQGHLGYDVADAE